MSFSLHSLGSSTLKTGIRGKVGETQDSKDHGTTLEPGARGPVPGLPRVLATDKDLTASRSPLYCRRVGPPASSRRSSLNASTGWALRCAGLLDGSCLLSLEDGSPQPSPSQPSPHTPPPLPAVLWSLCSATDTLLSGSSQAIRREPSGERRQGP